MADEFGSWLDGIQADDPFLGVVWFHEPHTPLGSPPELVDKYQKLVDTKSQATYYANIENVDRAVGKILDKLKSSGRDENTFVFLTSDNGGKNPWSNQGLRGKKSLVYEGGHREPGLIRWPGHVAENTVSSTPISHLDLLPTISEMVGAPPPQDRKLDGVSLLPLFSGKPITRTTPLFWFFYRVAPAAAMRVDDWVLLGYLDDPVKRHSHGLNVEIDMPVIKEAPLHRFELYNLKADLAQANDLSAAEPERLQKMIKRMKSVHREVVSDGPNWSQSSKD